MGGICCRIENPCTYRAPDLAPSFPDHMEAAMCSKLVIVCSLILTVGALGDWQSLRTQNKLLGSSPSAGC
jgi:hypothetical protein